MVQSALKSLACFKLASLSNVDAFGHRIKSELLVVVGNKKREKRLSMVLEGCVIPCDWILSKPGTTNAVLTFPDVMPRLNPGYHLPATKFWFRWRLALTPYQCSMNLKSSFAEFFDNQNSGSKQRGIGITALKNPSFGNLSADDKSDGLRNFTGDYEELNDGFSITIAIIDKGQQKAALKTKSKSISQIENTEVKANSGSVLHKETVFGVQKKRGYLVDDRKNVLESLRLLARSQQLPRHIVIISNGSRIYVCKRELYLCSGLVLKRSIFDRGQCMLFLSTLDPYFFIHLENCSVGQIQLRSYFAKI
ncbi:uncharacterized protein EV154DRAFT_554334 [Mucor mucedo]|uniref:uncharacterized protein n=1 Tax=Mucor mucedo TaxID=29922 RepID=UPI002220C581|nr:uncharacterized protein EV154DRAFT_554334 [Mucor mucedo]KAI7887793.1 hypothetical protein EV154DRAFT_554334 [Mucor mucedo]